MLERNKSIVLLTLLLGCAFRFLWSQTPLPPGKKIWLYESSTFGNEALTKGVFHAAGKNGSGVLLTNISMYQWSAKFFDSTATAGWETYMQYNTAKIGACITELGKVWLVDPQGFDIISTAGLWESSFAFTGGIIKYVEADRLGNVYILVKTSNGFALGKSSSTGSIFWWKTVNLPLASDPKRLTLLEDGSIYVTCSPFLTRMDTAGNHHSTLQVGTYSEAAVLNDHSFAVTQSSGMNFYVTKSDYNGVVLWRHRYQETATTFNHGYNYTGIVADRIHETFLIGGNYQYVTANPPCPTASYTWNFAWFLRTDAIGTPTWYSSAFLTEYRLHEMHQDVNGYAMISMDRVWHQIPCWSRTFTTSFVRTTPEWLTEHCFGGGAVQLIHGPSALPNNYLPISPSISTGAYSLVARPWNETIYIGGAPLGCRTCPKPYIDFDSQVTGNTVTFTDSVYNFHRAWWDFGDGTIDSVFDPTHTYSQNGVYNVCLIAENHCGRDTLCQLVNVNCQQSITSAFSFSSTLQQFSFQDLSSGSIPISWTWDFGDGTSSSLQNPTHQYASAGYYNVCLTVTDSCGPAAGSTYCQQVFASCPQNLNAAFSQTINLLQVAFYDQTTGINPIAWNWTFGDGNSSNLQNPIHTYAQGGAYLVRLIVWDSCGVYGGDTVFQTITVNCPQNLSAAFSETSILTQVDFTDLSAGSPVFWQWDFGDGGTSNQMNPTHFYSQFGNFLVCLAVQDSCGDTDTSCQSVNVNSVGILNSHQAPRPTVHPNPFKEQITIDLQGLDWSQGRLTFFSIDGRKVCQQNLSSGQSIQQIPVPGFSSGTYLLMIKLDQSQFHYLISKQ